MTPQGASFRAPIAWIARTAIAAVCFTMPVAIAQKPARVDLEQELPQGGFVLVISEAQARSEVPEERERATSNFKGEAELDEHGQGQMLVIGYAFRALKMHVDHTLSAPAFRSRQSAVYLGFGDEVIAPDATDAAWLAQRVREAPPAGRNTVIVADSAVIAKAFARDARNLGDAETLIYRPREGGAEFVARLATADWAKLAVN